MFSNEKFVLPQKNFFRQIFLLTKDFFQDKRFFSDKKGFDPKKFQTQIFWYPMFILNQIFFWNQKILLAQIFFYHDFKNN